MNIGKNIVKFRKEKNLTQEELANKVNVSPKTISSYENGRNLPNIDMLISLSEILGVTIDDILGQKKNDKEIAKKEFEKKTNKNLLTVLIICIISGLFFMISEYIIVGSITYLNEIKYYFEDGLRENLFQVILRNGIVYYILIFLIYLGCYLEFNKPKNYKRYFTLTFVLGLILIILLSILF